MIKTTKGIWEKAKEDRDGLWDVFSWKMYEGRKMTMKYIRGGLTLK